MKIQTDKTLTIDTQSLLNLFALIAAARGEWIGAGCLVTASSIVAFLTWWSNTETKDKTK